MTRPDQPGLPRRLRHSSGEGRYSLEIEQARGPIYLVRERGYADDEAGSAAVELFEQLLAAVQECPLYERVHLCVDYSSYRGSSTATRMAMLRRVVGHPALGVTAFHGAPWHTRTAVALLRAVHPRLEARHFPERDRALAYLDTIVQREGREPPPSSLLDEVLRAGLQRSSLVMFRLRENEHAGRFDVGGAARPSIAPPTWSWRSDDGASQVHYRLVDEDVVIARVAGPFGAEVIAACARVEEAVAAELGPVRLYAIYDTRAALPSAAPPPAVRSPCGLFTLTVVAEPGRAAMAGRLLASGGGTGGEAQIAGDLDEAWQLIQRRRSEDQTRLRACAPPEDPAKLRALVRRQHEALLRMKDSQELLFESIARIAWSETRSDELARTEPAAVDRGDGFWALEGALHLMRRDIAEMLDARDRQAAELARATAAAREASEAKSRFLGVISHELRTPLNAIAGLSTLLAGGGGLDGNQAAHVDGIRTASRRLERLVEDLLDFTRLEAGALRLVAAPFDLDDALKELLSTFGGQAKERGLELLIPPATAGPRRVGDRDRLLQVLDNLLDNAIRFTDQGSVRVEVTLEEASARFEVRDTGRGIAPEDLHRIFVRFEQTRPRAGELAPGVGLGLNIARHLVRLMGGELEVESRVGLGTCFRFRVPLPVADDQAAVEPSARALACWPDARILVVEDDRLSRVVAKGLLEQLGCRVHCCEDGLEAVEAWSRQPIDLVLMDCQLPRMDGFEATRTIRRRGGQTPIVAMTAHAMDEDRARAAEAGMDGFLVKPVSDRRLADVLHRHLPEHLRRDPGTDRGAALAGTDPARVAELFGEGAPGLIGRLREAVARGDGAEIADVAHRLLGQAAILEAPALADLCRPLAVEGLGEAETADRVQRIADEVTRLLERLNAQTGTAPRTGEVEAAHRGRLLLVDDDPLVLELTATTLRRVGYRVVTADEPEAALLAFRSAPAAFDALVLDQRLPGTTGMELLGLLRGLRPGIPALICSGEEVDDIASAPPGPTAFALKPIRLRELDRLLRGLQSQERGAPGR